MADIKGAYGSPTTITITLTSLAAGAAREGAEVDNSSNKFLDALVWVQAKGDNSGSAGNSLWKIYAWSSPDSTYYPDAVTGADAAITLNDPTQLKLIGVVYADAINTSFKSDGFSVAAAFGGKLPKYWGIVFVNDTSFPLTGTGGDHIVTYQGIYATAA